MNSNFSNIKKRLSMSTTLPVGSAGSTNLVTMKSASHHHHEHKDDGSCCKGHDHKHNSTNITDQEDEECDEDHTNPSGGCGCC